jgi:hypothetical protein
MEIKDNPVYWEKRNVLVSRVEINLANQVSAYQWDTLSQDISDFMKRYPDSHGDISLWIGLVACSTHGFLNINSSKFNECKTWYGKAEKIYKEFSKRSNLESSYMISAIDQSYLSNNNNITGDRLNKLSNEHYTNDIWSEIPDEWKPISKDSSSSCEHYAITPSHADIAKYQNYRSMYIKCWACYLIGTLGVKILFQAGKFFITKI